MSKGCIIVLMEVKQPLTTEELLRQMDEQHYRQLELDLGWIAVNLEALKDE